MEKRKSLKNIQTVISQNKIVSNVNYSTNPFYMYSKQVKSNDTKVEIINDHNTEEKLQEVIDSLLSLGVRKKLDDLNLKINPVKWVKSLFLAYPEVNNEHMEYLLQDFTDAMNTKMKSNDMYVVSIMTEKKLILCHSRMGEKSINPKWRVFERMLDKDNIKRFVAFEYTDNEINVAFYEKERTMFFIDWLGISKKDAVYDYGGANKFYSQIDGFPIALEITDDDFEKILDGKSLKIREQSIIFDSKIHELPITHIMRGRRKYSNTKDFAKYFMARKFDLAYYTDEYQELVKSLAPIMMKIFDDEDKLSSLCGAYFLKKENDNFQVIFCNNNIEIRDTYVNKFKTALINNTKMKIFHAGLDLNENPLRIRNFEIYNHLDTSLSKPLIDYFNNHEFGDSFSNDLRYAIFNVLARDNRDEPIYKLFISLCEKFEDILDFNSKIKEDSVIELKSKAFLEAKDKEIVERLGEDIKNKLGESDYKLYIIGYDEKTKEYEPFIDRFDDSRLDNLNRNLKKFTKLDFLELFKINYDKKQCILMLSVKSS